KLCSDRIAKESEHQYKFDKRQFVKKVVITVPQYFNQYRKEYFLISSAIEAAKSTEFEIIDVIEETYADLLYYMSNEKYSQTSKPGMKIATFDIRDGSFISRVYQILEYKEKRY